MYNRFLDTRKTLEVILFVSEKEHDLRRIMKYLYFADKLHLELYGRFITGDYYVKMDQGPVPSGAYDIAKAARGDLIPFDERIIHLSPKDSIIFRNRVTIIGKRSPDLKYLSESDIQCLDQTIETLRHYTDNELIDLGHDEIAWQDADINGAMDMTKIVLSLPNGVEILQCLEAD